MRLVTVSASNLKGLSFKLSLEAANAIVGPNFSGKTAGVEAIRLLFKGYIPEIGKKPSSTIELSSGAALDIAGTFDDGATVSRRFWTDGKSTKEEWSVPKDRPDIEALAEIPLLHADYYFGLTDGERTNYVFERVKLPDSYSARSLVAEMERISLEEEHSEQIEKAKASIIGELRPMFEGVEGTLQEAITAAVEKCRERYTYWNRRAKETQGAVATLTELKLREKDVQAAPVNLNQDIAKIQEQLDDTNSERGKLTQEKTAADAAKKQKAAYQKWLDEDRTDHDTIISRLKEEKLTLAHSFEDLSDSIVAIDVGELRAENKRLGVKLEQVRDTYSAASEAEKEAAKGLAELATLKACPYCQSKGKDWKATLSTVLTEKQTEAHMAAAAAALEREALLDRTAHISKQIEQFESARAQCQQMQAKLADLTTKIQTAITNKQNDDNRREQWKTELDKIVVPDVEEIDGKLQAVEKARGELLQTLAGLRARQTAETRLRQDLIRAAEAQEEHLEAAAQRTMTKKVAELLNQRREGMICDVFQKLLAVGNEVVTGIMRSPLVLHEGTIGRFAGARFVPHRVFSGTEKALAYIAIALALSQDSPFKLVLLDEFGRLEEKNQILVINKMLGLVKSGRIDQFIIIGTSVPKGAAKALNVIELK
jgi:hypothetical protein